jgi:hypothetical protein
VYIWIKFIPSITPAQHKVQIPRFTGHNTPLPE